MSSLLTSSQPSQSGLARLTGPHGPRLNIGRGRNVNAKQLSSQRVRIKDFILESNVSVCGPRNMASSFPEYTTALKVFVCEFITELSHKAVAEHTPAMQGT